MEQINRYIVRVSNDHMKDEKVYYEECPTNYIEDCAYNLSRDLWDEYFGWTDLARELGWNPDEIELDSPEEEQMIEEVEFKIQENPPFNYSYRMFNGTDEEWNKLDVIKW